MNKAAIIKIVGLLVVPILVMLIAMYLLYPMINSDKYDKIVENGGWPTDSTLVDSLGFNADSLMADSLYADSLMVDSSLTMAPDWSAMVDSLNRVIYVLNSRIQGLEQIQDEQEQAVVKEEDFKDQVKSLLNLDEDEMSPILAKMTNDQIVRIYKEAGNSQREKILRSLSSDRAARLITEIML